MLQDLTKIVLEKRGDSYVGRTGSHRVSGGAGVSAAKPEKSRRVLLTNFIVALGIPSIGLQNAKLIAKALFEGDSESASDNIFDLLKSYVSIRDFATKAKKENFYHGFLSGVFTNCSNFITDFKSNSESGDGYADLMFMNERRKKDKNITQTS